MSIQFQSFGEMDAIEQVQFVKGTIGNEQIRMSVHSFISDGVLIDTGASSLQAIFKAFLKNIISNKLR